MKKFREFLLSIMEKLMSLKKKKLIFGGNFESPDRSGIHKAFSIFLKLQVLKLERFYCRNSKNTVKINLQIQTLN